MCSELFRIPYTWGGVPIFGFGVLLTIWALACAAIVVGLVRRHGWSREISSALPVMLLLGAAILFLPRIFPDGMPIRGYGVMLLVGICAAVGLGGYRARQAGIDQDLITSLAVWLVVCGVVGARLFHVIEYWDERFAGKDPAALLLEILNIPEGGLVIYGGLFGGIAGFLVFVHRHRLPLWAMADLVAPSLAVGLAFGRIGCLLNGCCYGGPTDRPWAVTFPRYSSPYEAAKPLSVRRYSPPYADQVMHGEMHGFRMDAGDPEPVVVTRVDKGSPAAAAGLHRGDAIVAVDGVPLSSLTAAKELVWSDFESQRPLRVELASGKTIVIAAVVPPDRSRPVHPAQLYSAIDAGLLAWLLWSFYPFRRHDGEVIALLFTLHPITRFLLEVIRTDEPAVFGTGMSISQNISIALLVFGIALWWYLSKQPSGTVWPLSPVALSGRSHPRGYADAKPHIY